MKEKISQKNIESNLIKFISFLTALLLIIKTYSNSLTTDEAYTYLNYVFTKDFLNIGIANNHILNSFLMTITNNFSESVFFMRFPNLVLGILYLFLVYKHSVNSNLNFLIYGFLIGSPLFIEYFTLARGYGISAALNFLGFYLYYFTNLKYKFIYSVFSLILSCFSIHIYVIVLIAFLITNSKNEYRKSKFLLLTINIFSSLTIYIVSKIVFNITEQSKPLYGSEELNINLFLNFFDIVNLYRPKININFIISLTFLALVIYSIKYLKHINFNVLLIFLFLFLLPLVFNRPYPYGRILIPFLPIFIISFTDVIKNLKKNRKFIIFIKLLNIFLIFNMLSTFSFNSTIDWGHELDIELILETDQTGCNYLNQSYLQGQIYVYEYYRYQNSVNLPFECSS